jgi:hypothetical protein
MRGVVYASCAPTLCPEIVMDEPDYYGADSHEAASKFLGQIFFRLNIQQHREAECNRFVLSEPVQSAEGIYRERSR